MGRGVYWWQVASSGGEMNADPIVKVRVRSFWRGFLRGLASPGEVFRPPQIVILRRSDTEALRRDWEKIGGDFRAVMPHEHRDATAASR